MKKYDDRYKDKFIFTSNGAYAQYNQINRDKKTKIDLMPTIYTILFFIILFSIMIIIDSI